MTRIASPSFQRIHFHSFNFFLIPWQELQLVSFHFSSSTNGPQRDQENGHWMKRNSSPAEGILSILTGTHFSFNLFLQRPTKEKKEPPLLIRKDKEKLSCHKIERGIIFLHLINQKKEIKGKVDQVGEGKSIKIIFSLFIFSFFCLQANNRKKS